MRTKSVIQKTVLSAALFAILPAPSAHAAVPGLINYQGRLADANGAPVTGSKNFTLSIYDGETGGSLLYSEDIGAVTLDDNGVYSFQFGESGTSQATTTKLVGVADGVKNVYNTVLPASAMGVSSIEDGTYTWTPTNGSSSPSSFIGSYDAASKTVSAIYIGAAPESGTEISVNYQNSTDGIAEALGSGLEHWMEISFDGTVQGTRQRVLAVPFAAHAKSSNNAKYAEVANSAPKAEEAITQLDKYIGAIALRSFDDGNQVRYVDSNFVCVYPSARLAPAAEGSFSGIGGNTFREVLLSPTFVRYAEGFRIDSSMIFKYEDGSSNESDEFEKISGEDIWVWSNPDPSKVVVSIVGTSTDSNNTKAISAVSSEPVHETINVENIPVHVSGVFPTITRVNYLPTDIATIQVNGQLGSQVLRENEYTKLDATIGPIRSVTIGVIPSKLEARYPAPYISGVSLRFSLSE